MDTEQRTRHTVPNPFLRTVRQCYQSFLLHLMLGLSVSGLLLLCVIALNARLPTAVQTLNAAVFLVKQPTAQRNWKAVLSQTVYEQAVYSLPGVADAYFIDTNPAWEPNRTASYPAAEERLYIKDSTEPLEHPVLNTASVPRNNSTADVPGGHVAIRAVDLSQSTHFNADNGGILLSNQTDYAVDPRLHLASAYPIDAPTLPVMTLADRQTKKADAPLVLILHTHGTEAYAPDGAASVPSDYPYRSDDVEKNVVSVGAVLAKTLTDAGISVLHCETMFDADSYPDSYDLAAAYIRKTVADYPSIQYVFDVHRDALQSSDGSMLRPITSIGAEVCAQVMSVVGTDGAGAYYPDWRDNLTVAVHLQKWLNDAYSGFVRPINLRTATFNAQYAPGSLLLEIGAAGNSLEEAHSAAYHLGTVLAKLILNP